ncbi:DNA cytosine methyltransferase [Herpetosiphon sp. NSE202]|uniref:DNA cytosine methyltransferase n=1 Tax=Herpetosiphon sp. NSE202 TaxID=3351349 RepID=UPI003632B7E5
MKQFRFIDLFAGIGGFRLGLEAAGGICVASAEIDQQAIKVYRQNWPVDSAEHNLGDIKAIQQLPAHDVLVGGVPCQPWSIAGKNQAFDDPRGQLWADVIRLVRINQPKAFIFENVKGLVDPRNRLCLESILDSFKELGYSIYYKLLNSFDYGVAQNRDRVFIIGVHQKLGIFDFSFPEYAESDKKLYQILDNLQAPSMTASSIPIQRNLFGERIEVGFNKLTPRGAVNDFFILNDIRNGPTSIHSWEIYPTTEREKQICTIIMRNRRNQRYGDCDGNPMSYQDIAELVAGLAESELQALVGKRILRQYADGKYEFFNRRLSGGIDGTYRIFLPNARFFGTLTARGMHDEIAEISVSGANAEEYKHNFIQQVLIPKRYRKITVNEAARLQGFPATFKFHSNQAANFRLIGNSVAPPVIVALGKALQSIKLFDQELCEV